MGNTESEFNKNDKLSPQDKQRMLDQNLLQQERIKNQILKGKMENTHKMMDELRRQQQMVPNSKNPLLTNPEVQREFLRNKKMQQELQCRAQIQKKQHIEDSSYNQINNFLSNLEVEEKEEQINKSHLFINQGTRHQNIVPIEDKKPEIGITNSDRDKLIRLIKKQKEDESQRNKLEHEKRRKEYESKLNLLEERNIDPYKILEISKTANMTQIKNAYKKKAKIYHPDRGGIGNQFQIITIAYMSIIEKHKRQQQDKQFTNLKDESKRELDKQNRTQRKNVNMKGNNFNAKMFNKIYEENKIYNPSDEGYSKWMDETEYDSDTTPKIFSSEFNLNVFNNSFNDLKEETSQEIIKYQEPQPISLSKQNYQELGGNAPGDYSNKGYTDYRKAHTHTTLINPNNVKIKQYKNVEELNRDRGKKTYLTPEETMIIERNKEIEKDKEDKRIMRLNDYDEMAFRQFERVNKLFLK
tara:strand:+ start:616 stop:2022 length:1407 start_codon:yes stop_codon:yes gene_type:complete